MGLTGLKTCEKKIEKIIVSETGSDYYTRYFVGDKSIAELELIAVVMLNRSGVTYIINSETYLLNDSGKTIVKIF